MQSKRVRGLALPPRQAPRVQPEDTKDTREIAVLRVLRAFVVNLPAPYAPGFSFDRFLPYMK